MAIPVARVHLAMAHAALSGLLPTPPESTMMPLLPTPPCVVLFPKSPPGPSHADSDERWDARRNATSSPSKPGRADSEERWDAHKNRKPASSASSGSGHPFSDSKVGPGRASSAERWDAHKKPRPPQQAHWIDDGASSTGSNDMESDEPLPRQPLFSGPGFVASPEPSMLPMPAPFLLRVA